MKRSIIVVALVLTGIAQTAASDPGHPFRCEDIVILEPELSCEEASDPASDVCKLADGTRVPCSFPGYDVVDNRVVWDVV